MCLRVYACLSTWFTLHNKTSLYDFSLHFTAKGYTKREMNKRLLCHVDAAMSYSRLSEAVPYCEPSPTLPYHNAPHHTTCCITCFRIYTASTIYSIIYTYIVQIDTCILFSSTSFHKLHLPQTSETNKKSGQTRHVGLRPLENASNAQGDLAGKKTGWRSFSGKNSIGS